MLWPQEDFKLRHANCHSITVYKSHFPPLRHSVVTETPADTLANKPRLTKDHTLCSLCPHDNVQEDYHYINQNEDKTSDFYGQLTVISHTVNILLQVAVWKNNTEIMCEFFNLTPCQKIVPQSLRGKSWSWFLPWNHVLALSSVHIIAFIGLLQSRPFTNFIHTDCDQWPSVEVSCYRNLSSLV